MTMCASGDCGQSKECYRHPDSGTKPGISQSWALYEAFNCEDYIPIKWEPTPAPKQPA